MNPFFPAPLPPEINWEKFIPLMGEANRGIARYDGLLQSLINPEILLTPLRDQEAVLSSRIEGTQASLEDVLEAEVGIKQPSINIQHDTQEIANYRNALLFAEKELEHRPLSLHLIKQIHEILMQSVRGKDKKPGQFRNTQNWIGTPGTPIEKARFVPPPPLQVEAFMKQWMDFANSQFQDEIVQLALLHAQFEIIHPFSDGNGRLGRLLIPLFLFSKKILTRPVFYISEFLENHRQEYYDRLLYISQNNQWQEWITFFLNAVIHQTRKNMERTKQILNLYNHLKIEFQEITRSQYAIPLLDIFFTRPIINSTHITEQLQINRITANNLLSKLTQNNIIRIRQKGKGRKPTVYDLPALLEIIST